LIWYQSQTKVASEVYIKSLLAAEVCILALSPFCRKNTSGQALCEQAKFAMTVMKCRICWSSISREQAIRSTGTMSVIMRAGVRPHLHRGGEEGAGTVRGLEQPLGHAAL